MTSTEVTIVNKLGLHARAAARFVQLAGRYRAKVRVARDGRQVDGKSIMGILLLAAARGAVITITADGIDEADAAVVAGRAGADRLRRRDVERLTGIGVSPGIAVGRAVVLTERTEVVRFPIPPERVTEEVAALEQARQPLPRPAHRDPRSPGRRRRPRPGAAVRRAAARSSTTRCSSAGRAS